MTEVRHMQMVGSFAALGQEDSVTPKKTVYLRKKFNIALKRLHENAGEKLVQVELPAFTDADGDEVASVHTVAPLDPFTKAMFAEPKVDVLAWLHKRVIHLMADDMPLRRAKVAPPLKGMYWHRTKRSFVVEKPAKHVGKRYKVVKVGDKDEPELDEEGKAAAMAFISDKGLDEEDADGAAGDVEADDDMNGDVVDGELVLK
jgi:hypothetical protein